jgi:hypothetical protein
MRHFTLENLHRLSQQGNEEHQGFQDPPSAPSGSDHVLNFALCLGKNPLFTQKASMYPNCFFLLGADTCSRLVNPKYYGNREEMLLALGKIRDAGCAFIVGGRASSSAGSGSNGRSNCESISSDSDFVSLSDALLMGGEGSHTTDSAVGAATGAHKKSPHVLPLPPSLLSMFHGLSEDDFRVDMSSTQLRNEKK